MLLCTAGSTRFFPRYGDADGAFGGRSRDDVEDCRCAVLEDEEESDEFPAMAGPLPPFPPASSLLLLVLLPCVVVDEEIGIGVSYPRVGGADSERTKVAFATDEWG